MEEFEEQDKYYTPEIEEFHVGFECELHKEYNGGAWVKLVVGQNTETGNGTYDADWCADNIDKIRVKHLDREDIESLKDWKITSTHDEVYSDVDEYRKEKYDNKEWYEMFHNRHTHSVRIYIVINVGAQEYRGLFVGTIKNLSELKRVLKMIGV